MKKLLTILICLLGFTQIAHATHYRAGEIVYKQIGARTFAITAIIYTKTSSAQADKDSIEVDFGDGTPKVWLKRSNGNGSGVDLPGNVKYSTYGGDNPIHKGVHTYGAQGTFKVSLEDKNRVGDVLNINFGDSQKPYYIETILKVLNAQFETNSSPILQQPPIDVGYIGQVFMHNPNAYDVEGDKITYEMIPSRVSTNADVPNYVFPNIISPGANNQIALDAVTGTFTWTSPQKEGEYNIAFLIKEYRKGRLLSTIIRDMQITIRKGENRPPVINAPTEFCVIAGTQVNFLVTALF